MTEPQPIAQSYIDVWNERSASARKEKLSARWASSAAYRDPMTKVEGLDAIDALIAGVQERFPAFRFELKPAASGYDGVVGFAWCSGLKAPRRRSRAATSWRSPTARSGA